MTFHVRPPTLLPTIYSMLCVPAPHHSDTGSSFCAALLFGTSTTVRLLRGACTLAGRQRAKHVLQSRCSCKVGITATLAVAVAVADHSPAAPQQIAPTQGVDVDFHRRRCQPRPPLRPATPLYLPSPILLTLRPHLRTHRTTGRNLKRHSSPTHRLHF